MVKVAVSVGPRLASAGSSECTRRRGAALGTREETPSVSDPTGRPGSWSHAAPKQPIPLRPTIHAGGGRDGERVGKGSACGFVDEPAPVRAALDEVTARLFDESPLLGLLYRPDGTVSLGPQCG